MQGETGGYMTVEKKQVLTVKNIRNVNMENILQSMFHHQNVTRSTLAKENQISLMTVKHVVDDLIDAGILVERESLKGDVGRKPKVLELSARYGNIVCLNLTSKDEISFLIYDIYRNLQVRQSFFASQKGSYLEGFLEVLHVIQTRLKDLTGDLVGIAVFVPSAYDKNRDLVNYDLVPGLKKLHIRSLLEQEFGIKNIQVFHDVFAAARAEYDSEDPKAESQFYFYCGYGVGGYFIHRDVAVSGSERMAGEVGKMLVSMEGESTDERTLEEVASVLAVESRCCTGSEIDSLPKLIQRYQEQDPTAVSFLEPILNTISKVLYNLLWVYNPTRIVVDSCEREYGELIAEHFYRFMEKMRNEAIPIHVEIRQARYDEYHMMWGCFHMTRNAWIEEIADSV